MISTGIIELDIHGLNKRRAKTLIDSRLRAASNGVYRIRVIHGCHRGTELRDMVRSEYINHPRVLRLELGVGAGVTDLVLRELF
ncbi:MAG: Smr/MutS family protein [Oscillospiraceae bacterium]|nr:Smr/MutS family protein [Oscillospiraceae bacterium]